MAFVYKVACKEVEKKQEKRGKREVLWVILFRKGMLPPPSF
jgi:hypothetical protein